MWIDIEQMGGSTLEAMAEAVENAALVLVCASEKYKMSPNCRTGAFRSLFSISLCFCIFFLFQSCRGGVHVSTEATDCSSHDAEAIQTRRLVGNVDGSEEVHQL